MSVKRYPHNTIPPSHSLAAAITCDALLNASISSYPLRFKKEQKSIDDAKALLMERNHLSEEEAHKYIQKLSMDSGNNLVETAEMILAFD